MFSYNQDVFLFLFYQTRQVSMRVSRFWTLHHSCLSWVLIRSYPNWWVWLLCVLLSLWWWRNWRTKTCCLTCGSADRWETWHNRSKCKCSSVLAVVCFYAVMFVLVISSCPTSDRLLLLYNLFTGRTRLMWDYRTENFYDGVSGGFCFGKKRPDLMCSFWTATK